MTNKDWKKIAETKRAIAYQYKKRIGNGFNPLLTRIFKGNESWVVSIGLIGGYPKQEFFKTKSKALAYARSYMRKH